MNDFVNYRRANYIEYDEYGRELPCNHYFDELRKDKTKINTCVHCGYEEEL